MRNIIQNIYSYTWNKIAPNIQWSLEILSEKTLLIPYVKRMYRLYYASEFSTEYSKDNEETYAFIDTVFSICLLVSKYWMDMKVDYLNFINPLPFASTLIIKQLIISLTLTGLLAGVYYLLSKKYALTKMPFASRVFLNTCRSLNVFILILLMLGMFIVNRAFVTCNMNEAINGVDFTISIILSFLLFYIPLKIIFLPVYKILNNNIHGFFAALLIGGSIFLSFALAVNISFTSLEKSAINYDGLMTELKNSQCAKSILKNRL